MENSLSKIQENLRLGVKAARTGRNEEARVHLQMVLEHNADHILALLWLAFVAPEPAESVRLLERVLALEPDNERAKAGLIWVQQQAAAEEGESGEAQPDADDDQSSGLFDQSLRDQFLSKADAQQRAKKGALAHRARRTIDPLLVVAVILGAVMLLSLALVRLGVLSPPIGLASLSAPAESVQPIEQPRLPQPEAVSGRTKFTSQSDTIVLGVNKPRIIEAEPVIPSSILEAQPASAPPAFQVEDILVDNEPIELIESTELSVAGVRLFQPVEASLLVYQPVSPDEKWIEVNVTEQHVIAWEGNIPVMSFLSSTGLPGTPTVLGEYTIYWKLESTLMAGPGYYLPEVPYTMYFYRGYGLHGAYWHNSFGQPMSHGCVNLSIDDSKALFEWAGPVVPAGQTQVVASADNPGTLVVVHD